MHVTVPLAHGFAARFDPANPLQRIILTPQALIDAGLKLQRRGRNRVLAKKRQSFTRSVRLRFMLWLKH